MSVFDRREQEAFEQAERENEAYQDRMDAVWGREEVERESRDPRQLYSLLPPWLFADERSQRRAEAEARRSEKLDDYAAWQDEAVGAEQRFQ